MPTDPRPEYPSLQEVYDWLLHRAANQKFGGYYQWVLEYTAAAFLKEFGQ